LNRIPIFVLAMTLAGAISAGAPRASGVVPNAAHEIVAAYARAWNAGNPLGIAQLFAGNGDFINPEGIHAGGRREIEAFYAAAFKSGYTGSKGEGGIIAVRAIAPTLAIIDGQWRISGAKKPDGSPRAVERGILTGVIERTAHGWRILALRETASATKIIPLASAR